MGTYAALENNSPAAAGGPISASPESAATPTSPHEAGRSAPAEEIGGTVMEVIQVPSFTYLRLERSGRWIAGR